MPPSFNNLSKSAAISYAGLAKSASPFALYLKHGQEPNLQDLASFTFESVVFPDGTQLKDVTFEQLSNLAWSLVSKS